jgi:hypothetical protein
MGKIKWNTSIHCRLRIDTQRSESSNDVACNGHTLPFHAPYTSYYIETVLSFCKTGAEGYLQILYYKLKFD